MKKLLLKKQFYMIDNQYKVAEDKTQTSENLIKILSRCIKMYDAQQEIMKILALLHTRIEKKMELKKELRGFAEAKIKNEQERYDLKPIRKMYQEMVRLSARIMSNIRTLKDIERAMTRPFVFSGARYDEDYMFYQMKRLRLKIIKQIPRLKDTVELKMFYT